MGSLRVEQVESGGGSLVRGHLYKDPLSGHLIRDVVKYCGTKSSSSYSRHSFSGDVCQTLNDTVASSRSKTFLVQRKWESGSSTQSATCSFYVSYTGDSYSTAVRTYYNNVKLVARPVILTPDSHFDFSLKFSHVTFDVSSYELPAGAGAARVAFQQRYSTINNDSENVSSYSDLAALPYVTVSGTGSYSVDLQLPIIIKPKNSLSVSLILYQYFENFQPPLYPYDWHPRWSERNVERYGGGPAYSDDLKSRASFTISSVTAGYMFLL